MDSSQSGTLYYRVQIHKRVSICINGINASSLFLRRLRLHSSEALCVNTEPKESASSSCADLLTTLWGKVWSLAADFGPEILGEHSQCLRRQVPVRGEDGQSLASTELLILRMEAATFLILENPDANEAESPRSKVTLWVMTVMTLFLHIYIYLLE